MSKMSRLICLFSHNDNLIGNNSAKKFCFILSPNPLLAKHSSLELRNVADTEESQEKRRPDWKPRHTVYAAVGILSFNVGDIFS